MYYNNNLRIVWLTKYTPILNTSVYELNINLDWYVWRNWIYVRQKQIFVRSPLPAAHFIHRHSGRYTNSYLFIEYTHHMYIIRNPSNWWWFIWGEKKNCLFCYTHYNNLRCLMELNVLFGKCLWNIEWLFSLAQWQEHKRNFSIVVTLNKWKFLADIHEIIERLFLLILWKVMYWPVWSFIFRMQFEFHWKLLSWLGAKQKIWTAFKLGVLKSKITNGVK